MPKDRARQISDKEYLDAWRDLELALKEEGQITAQDLEGNLQARSRTADTDRLRICRQVRNFIMHGGAGFVTGTDAMRDFLRGLEHEIRRVRGVVKDHMVTSAKYGCVGPNELVCKAASLALTRKHGDVLVIDGDKNLIGVFGPEAMAKALAEGACADRISFPAVMKLLDRDVQKVRYDDPSRDAPDKRCVVLDPKGRCVGVYNPEKGWR